MISDLEATQIALRAANGAGRFGGGGLFRVLNERRRVDECEVAAFIRKQPGVSAEAIYIAFSGSPSVPWPEADKRVRVGLEVFLAVLVAVDKLVPPRARPARREPVYEPAIEPEEPFGAPLRLW